MPTSVLLAVLVGAGLLALAPALVRRYDADERIAADLEDSAAKVLARKPRSRTVPGPAPINPPLAATSPDDGDADDAADADDLQTGESSTSSRRRGWERSGARRGESVPLRPVPAAQQDEEVPVAASAQMRAWWRRRHRRILYVLIALVLVELAAVVIVGPGFWLGFALSLGLLLAFVRFLRMRVVREQSARAAAPEIAQQGVRSRVYVPIQSGSDDPAITAMPAGLDPRLTDGGESAAVAESSPPEDDCDDSPRGFVPGFDDPDPDSEDPPTPSASTRRRTGGIRGRSYESPANL